ncbi:CCC motif membrane protein [Tenacibaculum pacificus]|uniref:CCC motif membrane protein n=1 Tax=Tenacibaculum pacificus TaxID=3018314 RepID=UPI0022F3FD27|nr:CCC motif membrane protein [Tenacibaculum pacificus]WBX74609.1 CCC motif membrane protein [Tenacibaculum pacificus]
MEKQNLPNATVALVLGICSIVTRCCYGVIGLPLGIAAYIMGNKAVKIDNENPDEYEGVKNANTAKILGIIGIVLNILYLICIIYVFSLIGWDAIGNEELMMERLNELQDR